MRKHSLATENIPNNDFSRGSRNWLLHARYVRGEHGMCQDLADELQRENDNKHRYAHYVKVINHYLSLTSLINLERKMLHLSALDFGETKNFSTRRTVELVSVRVKGSVLADAGRLQEALERFHACLRLQPQDPEPLKQVAKCLYRQGRFQLSLEAYLEADKLTKLPDADIYCSLAESAWNLGDTQRGVEWARSAVQAGGGERAGALLARLLIACDEIHGALAAYEHVLSSHACGADTLAAAGALRLRAGDPRGAFQLLGAALAQQSTQHAAALALAAMMLQHKDLDAALARLKAALSAHPTCVAAHSNLGLALIGKKKYVAALTCLQRAVWSAPLSGRASHNLGLALLTCRRPASAFCRLATAAALQPTQPYTVLLIAIALERLGDSRSDSAYARAVAMAPSDPLLSLNLAGRHARAGRFGEAIKEAVNTAKLIEEEEKPDAHLASSLSTLISMLKEVGVEVPSLRELELPARKEDLNVTEDGDMAVDEV